jgi:hypothetical protein
MKQSPLWSGHLYEAVTCIKMSLFFLFCHRIFHMNWASFKMLHTGDCFIEVTAWAGFTVFHIVNNVMKHIFKIQFWEIWKSPLWSSHIYETVTSMKRSPLWSGHLYEAVTSMKQSPLWSSHLYEAVTSMKQSPLWSSHLYEAVTF